MGREGIAFEAQIPILAVSHPFYSTLATISITITVRAMESQLEEMMVVWGSEFSSMGMAW